MAYDSRPDTRAHIETVRSLVALAVHDLQCRAIVHDDSKLNTPEVEVFNVVTPKLAELTYGSDEYKESLAEMGPALEHHYAVNDHHPEHFENGVSDMTMAQMLEMCCDWTAAARRHTGDPRQVLKSLDHNAVRFGYGEEIKALIERTILDILDKEVAAYGP